MSTYENIIWLDVRVHYIAFPQKTHGKEKLVGICPHGPNVQTHVLSEALDDIS